MKKNKEMIMLIACLLSISAAHTQFGGLGKMLKDKGAEVASVGALNKILKQPQAISTSFKDVNKTGFKPPSFTEGQQAQPLYLLPKASKGGFKLCAGFYEITNKSYCLHAGYTRPQQRRWLYACPGTGCQARRGNIDIKKR